LFRRGTVSGIKADDWWGSALGSKPASMKAPTTSAAVAMGASPTAKTPKKKAASNSAYTKARAAFDSAREDWEYDHESKFAQALDDTED
jgi:hypothetical protein